MNTDNPKARFVDAQNRFRQGQVDAALAILDQLDNDFPNDNNIVYARARCLAKLGRVIEARELGSFLHRVLGDPRGAELLATLTAPTDNRPKRTALGFSFKKPALIALALAVVTVAVLPIVYSTGVALEVDSGPIENPTYSKHIAPIFNRNCVECHRPGEAVPMALMSYDQVRPWVKSIRNMVESRQMPPWHADPSIGSWKNDRRLSDRDIDTIVRWADQDAPRGNPADAPQPLAFTEGWKIGTPDIVFSMYADEVLPPELVDEYRYVFIPTGFSEDRWIQAAEVRPGNVDVVHHVIVLTASMNDIARGDFNEGAIRGSLGGYAPGAQPLVMEKGRGMKLAAGSILVLQMHYHKEPGTTEYDNTSIGLQFARGKVEKELRFDTVGTQRFVIPPGAPNHPVQAQFTVKRDIHIEQLVPHMHLRGKNMHVWAILPNGQQQDLISIPNYDFNWQTFYELEKPIALPKGTEIHALAHFDNSPENPFNPNPNAEVRWGLPTTAEMMYSFFAYTVDDERLKARDPGPEGNS